MDANYMKRWDRFGRTFLWNSRRTY